jgi:hypothetical protein
LRSQSAVAVDTIGGVAQLWSLGGIVRMTKYKLSLLALILASGFALYSFLYFAWLTATPLSAGQLARAQYDCYCWFAFFVVGVLLSIFLVLRMIRLRRKMRNKVSV